MNAFSDSIETGSYYSEKVLQVFVFLQKVRLCIWVSPPKLAAFMLTYHTRQMSFVVFW